MTTYEADLDLRRLVQWLRADVELASPRLLVVAEKAYVADGAVSGDDPAESANAVLLVGTLSVRPLGSSPGWTLSVQSTLPLSLGVPDDEDGLTEEIDAELFAEEFLGRKEAVVTTTVLAESESGWSHFGTWLAGMQRADQATG